MKSVWVLFSKTGDVNAYLFLKELEKNNENNSLRLEDNNNEKMDSIALR